MGFPGEFHEFYRVDKSQLSQWIKQEGARLGFDLTGIARVERLDAEALDLEKWLKLGRHGTMDYMERNFDARVDPSRLVEGAKSVISVMQPYFPQAAHQQPGGAPKISRYAWGEDYHTVLKRKLYALFAAIQQKAGDVQGRVFVDSAPVMDKAWGKRAGLGWIGKNTNLIHARRGSWFFLGEIILDLELDYDGPSADHCGTCTRCIDACPTGALAPYQIDASRCISYLTIELKSEIPAAFRDHMEGWAYGCDICQEVCPWNRFTQPQQGDFDPLAHIGLTPQQWEELTPSAFNKLIRPTAMSRVKRGKWLDTLRFLKLLPQAHHFEGEDDRRHEENEVAKGEF